MPRLDNSLPQPQLMTKIRPEIHIDEVINILSWSGKVTPTSNHPEYNHDKARRQLALLLERTMDCPGKILLPSSMPGTSEPARINAEAFMEHLNQFMRDNAISVEGFWSDDHNRETIAHGKLIAALRRKKEVFDQEDAKTNPRLPRENDLAGTHSPRLTAFLATIRERQQNGTPLTKSEEALCQFVADCVTLVLPKTLNGPSSTTFAKGKDKDPKTRV